MFSSGANVDLKKIEEEIRKEIEEKRKRLFTDEELEELQKLELSLLPNPDRVRTYFHKPLEMELPEGDYNINIDTFVFSSHSKKGQWVMRFRNWFRPFFRLYGNIDALIHKQATFNENIVHSLERPFHYIRVLHTLNNYLVAELTKLSLQHQALKNQVESLAYDMEQLRKRERLIEKLAVLKDEPQK
jgi:hypothetical protein